MDVIESVCNYLTRTSPGAVCRFLKWAGVVFLSGDTVNFGLAGSCRCGLERVVVTLGWM